MGFFTWRLHVMTPWAVSSTHRLPGEADNRGVSWQTVDKLGELGQLVHA
jgi:hypothetical protein